MIDCPKYDVPKGRKKRTLLTTIQNWNIIIILWHFQLFITDPHVRICFVNDGTFLKYFREFIGVIL